MRFIELLQEFTSSASEQAKKLGLSSLPFGRWADKKGRIVARTIDGKLVRVGGERDAPKSKVLSKIKLASDDPEFRPTGMSARAAGKTKTPQPGKTDIQKQNGTLRSSRSTTSAPEQGPRPTRPNPYRLNTAPWGRNITADEAHKLFPENSDPFNVLREIVPGEEVEYVDTHQMQNFFDALTQEDFARWGHYNHKADADRQDTEWRDKLDNADYVALTEVQWKWQIIPKSRRSPAEQKAMNDTINAIANKKPRPVVNTTNPIERGMSLDADEIGEFFKGINVGKELDLPPSGFSSSPSTAREYAVPGGGEVGVLFRLAPNAKGHIYGIHCTNVSSRPKQREQVHKKLAKGENQLIHDIPQLWANEKEIIRPSGPKARCTRIKKLLFPRNGAWGGNVSAVYVVELEELGYDESLTEAWHTPLKNSIFDELMNTPFRQPKKSRNSNISLRELLESAASDEAHSLGLSYSGHGYWKDKSGKTVAKTIQDKLVKVDGPEADDGGEDALPQTHDIDEPEFVQGDEEDNFQTFRTDDEDTIPELNGIPFESWYDAPMTLEEWQSVSGTNPNIKEPEFPDTKKRPAAGCVIVEPDGRVWAIEPKGHFGGYKHMFPKGGHEKGLSLQQTAIKEAFEETGLRVELVDFLGDFERDTSTTRYYIARRVGGTPVDHGYEAQSVKLIPPSDFRDYFNRGIEKAIAVTFLKRQLKEKPDDAELAGKIMAQKVGSQKGSNSGGFYKGADGVLRYVKEYSDPTRSKCEALANDIYRDLGLGAPQSTTFTKNGKTLFASNIIPGKTLGHTGLTKEIANKILDGFVADVLVGNWDTIGLANDNVLIDANGEPQRIDNGGTFLFRAMESSGRKPDSLINAISEWKGFADRDLNPQYAAIFKAAGIKSPEDLGERLYAQVKGVLKLRGQYGGWANYVDTHITKLNPSDRKQIIEQLESRTKLLMGKVKHFYLAEKEKKKKEAAEKEKAWKEKYAHLYKSSDHNPDQIGMWKPFGNQPQGS